MNIIDETHMIEFKRRYGTKVPTGREASLILFSVSYSLSAL